MPAHQKHTISTHVLDNERGQPAVGVAVTLERLDGAAFEDLTRVVTNQDGRVPDLLPAGALEAGIYRIRFDAAGYFSGPGARQGGETPFVRAVTIEFEIVDTGRHYHVPLLMTRFACTSYRGS
jgi:5-hydroxyisourate hydrolase